MLKIIMLGNVFIEGTRDAICIPNNITSNPTPADIAHMIGQRRKELLSYLLFLVDPFDSTISSHPLS